MKKFAGMITVERAECCEASMKDARKQVYKDMYQTFEALPFSSEFDKIGVLGTIKQKLTSLEAKK